jgi:hypothetical protein
MKTKTRTKTAATPDPTTARLIDRATTKRSKTTSTARHRKIGELNALIATVGSLPPAKRKRFYVKSIDLGGPKVEKFIKLFAVLMGDAA